MAGRSKLSPENKKDIIAWHFGEENLSIYQIAGKLNHIVTPTSIWNVIVDERNRRMEAPKHI